MPSILNWLSVCPACGCDELQVESDSANLVLQGELCTCKCGNTGYVVVYGPEECDVEWGRG